MSRDSYLSHPLAVPASPTPFRFSGMGFRVSGFEFRVSGFGFLVSGFGFRALGCGTRRPCGDVSSGLAEYVFPADPVTREDVL